MIIKNLKLPTIAILAQIWDGDYLVKVGVIVQKTTNPFDL